jgi:uncharacterized sulfatase
LVIVLGISQTLAAVPTSAPRPSSPNILFILGDDLGYGDLGSYANPTKHRRLLTPSLDELASQGMRFTQSYAGYSVCAPSRFTLMTGRHCGHAPTSGQLTANDTTVATLLQQAGYHTGLIGKWGLDGNFKVPRSPGAGFPTRHGFDFFLGQSDQWQCHNYYPSFQFLGDENTTIRANLGASTETCGADRTNCEWTGDIWTAAAVDFIRNATSRANGVQQAPVPTAAKPKPFFLYLAFTTPHAGSVGSIAESGVPVPLVSQGPYANETAWPAVERAFATAVTDLDAAVGRVLAAIEDAGVADSTIVMFSSDNGAHEEGGHDHQFFNSSGYLHGFKKSIHDGGHRAALVVRGPGVPAGVVTDMQTAFCDFLPTALDFAGAELPPGMAARVDGRSIAPTLRGKTQPQPPFVYHDFSGINDAPGFGWGQNVRVRDADGDWAGVCVTKNGVRPCDHTQPNTKFLLYDMQIDEAQQTDVSQEHPDIVRKLQVIMTRECGEA